MNNRSQTVTSRKIPAVLEHCVTRRQFLFMGAAAVGTVTLATVMPGQSVPGPGGGLRWNDGRQAKRTPGRRGRPVQVPVGPRKLRQLPHQAGHTGWREASAPTRMLSPSTLYVPHMGISLLGSFKLRSTRLWARARTHLSTYDLTRHGMMSFRSLPRRDCPRLVLEARGDEIYATGVMALIYGFGDNEVRPV